MPDLLIRNLPEELKRLLAIEAKKHGLSLSDQAQRLLADAIGAQRGTEPVGDAMRRVFNEAGFADLGIPRRNDFPVNPFEASQGK